MKLSDEQIQEMVKPFIKQVHWEYEWDVVGFARAIERALLDSSHLTQPVGQTVPGEGPACIKRIREIRDVQGWHGNWNYDSYMQGLYNGLEMALCIAEDRAPVFKKKPETGWLYDRHSADTDRLTPNEESPASPAAAPAVEAK